jgi:hypothetical protein
MKLFKRTPPSAPAPEAKANRRELLRAVLRDTLQRHGIPTEWIGAELLASTLSNGEHGLHWRLHLKHWEPKLLPYAVALEEALHEHLVAADPSADRWLTGISWQFAVKDRSLCAPLPLPQTWIAGRRGPPQHGPQADVENARADLNKMLSNRETEMPHSPDALPPTWAPTQPAKF